MRLQGIVEGSTSPVWRVLAWQDIVVRYRRSTLGPFWITLTTAAFVLGVGTLYAGLFGGEASTYMLYLGTGYILWQFIAASLTEGATTLIQGRDMLLNARIAPVTLVLRTLARNALILAHNLPVYAALALYAHPGGWEGLPYLIPGVIAFAGNALWISVVVAILAVRFRDIPPIVGALTQLLFLITPIFWRADSLDINARAAFVRFNPFAHILAAVREPLIGHAAPLESLTAALALAVGGLLVAAILYCATARRIPIGSELGQARNDGAPERSPGGR